MLTTSIEPLEKDAGGLFEEFHQAGTVTYHSIVIVIPPELGIQLFEKLIQSQMPIGFTPFCEVLQRLS